MIAAVQPDPFSTLAEAGFMLGVFMGCFFFLGCFFLMVWLFVPFALFGLKKRIDGVTKAIYDLGILLQQRLPPQGQRPGEDVKIPEEPGRDIFSAGRRS